MKAILRLALLSVCACLWGNEAADRLAIEKVMAALSEAQRSSNTKALTALFASDAAKTELDYLFQMDGGMLEASKRPWSEVTAPRILIKSIRFATPDVAVVDAFNRQFGPVLGGGKPLFLLKKRGEGAWKTIHYR